MMDEISTAFADSSRATEMALGHGHTTAIEDNHQEAQEETIAVSFMHQENRHHHAYLQEIRNQFLNWLDLYPRKAC